MWVSTVAIEMFRSRAIAATVSPIAASVRISRSRADSSSSWDRTSLGRGGWLGCGSSTAMCSPELTFAVAL